MHINPDNMLGKDILFSYGNYYTSLVRVLVWLSEATTEICWKKIVLIAMKKTLKKHLLKNFIFSKVTDCRHVTWLKTKLLHRYFLLCDWCYWLASAGLIAICWFTVFQNTLLAASASLLELFQKLWKYIVMQYPKKF